ncbi:MAG TPA: hypothetical protein VKX25_20905 [Bryobacteraceae bacterium]|jgi:hypothetical protein|nr:hypothetical protein [Bryobacteraceae bacterium]
MRRDPDFFKSDELDLLYMARTLRSALKLEDLLTAAGIDYLVETGTYNSGWLIRRELTGAFFYVNPGDLSRARQVLLENRYKPYEIANAK